MTGCSAINCKNQSSDTIRLYRFPTQPERNEIWARNCGRADDNPVLNRRLCQEHFEESQFENAREDGRRKLRPDAIPTIFEYSVPSHMKQNNEKTPTKKRDVAKRFYSCCFPGCTNSGYDRVLTSYCKTKKMLTEQKSDRYRMYKVHVTDKSHTFYRHHRRFWLPRIGLKLKQIEMEEQEPYLCDGHFSLHQYKMHGTDQIKFKNTAIPDLLEPNPPPILCRAMKDLYNGRKLRLVTDVKNSQMRSVPTNYNVKVREGGKFEHEDFQLDDLRIAVNYNVCCFCAKPVKPEEAIHLVNDTFDGVSDFGKIISILSSLTETPVLSAYTCKTCEDIVLSCFHRLVEINTKLILARMRLDEFLCVGALPEQLPCHSCNMLMENHDEYKDHLIIHALDRKEKPVVFRLDEPEEVEEGEVNATLSAADALHLDHPYGKSEEPPAPDPSFGVENTFDDAGIVLCDICGSDMEPEKLIQHLQFHRRKMMITALVECPICQKEVTRGSLPYHLKRHDENMPIGPLKSPRKCSFAAKTSFYSCQICGVRLKTLEERDTHKMEEHGVKKRNVFSCYHCEFKGRTTTVLKNHLRNTHPDKVVSKCEDCNIEFYHENAMLIHNAAKHKDLHRIYMERKKKMIKTSQALDGEKRRAKLKARLMTDEDQLVDLEGFGEDGGVVMYERVDGPDGPVMYERLDDEEHGGLIAKIDSDSEASQAIMYIDDNGYYTTAPGSSESVSVAIEDPQNHTWHMPELDSAVADEEIRPESPRNDEPILYTNEPDEPEQYYEWADDSEEMHVEALDDPDETVEYMEPVPATEYFVLEGNTVTKYLQYT